MQKIQFITYDRKPALKNRQRLKQFLLEMFIGEKIKVVKITYIFCSDSYIIRINREFLKHDFYTDVIAFDLSEPGMGMNAEIYISIDRLKDNADKEGETFKRELHRVMFHGALHLCGYKDKKEKDIFIMRAKEEKYLKLYLNLPERHL